MTRSASHIQIFLLNSKYFPHVQVTAVLDGKGWIVPCLLSEEECEQLITLGEEFGIGEEDFKAKHLLFTVQLRL